MQIYYSHRYSVYLKQNGTVSSFSVLSIFHSESYNFAHENHNCPFCSPAFFLKIFYQPGHYNVPGRALSTGFMVKFIVNPGKFLCFAKVDVYAAAFALIASMMFFIPSQTLISVKISEMLPRSVNGDSNKTERSFIIPL